MSIPEVGSKGALLSFLTKYLRKINSLVVGPLTATTLTVPSNSTSEGALAPVDFEQVGGLVIGEEYIPKTPGASVYSWTLSAPPTNAQDWHPSVNNDFWALAKIRFTVPASGKVRIVAKAPVDASSGNKRFYFRLCTDTSGTSLGTEYQRLVWFNDENSDKTVTCEWLVEGLTPGTATAYYLGAAINSGTAYIRAGGQCSGDTDVSTEAWGSLCMRAIAVANNVGGI
jgi:hypothetical protein